MRMVRTYLVRGNAIVTRSGTLHPVARNVAQSPIEGSRYRVRKRSSGGPAQPALAADGASRPQDQGFFESWNQLGCHPDLSVRRS
jgi:hypothetical protein